MFSLEKRRLKEDMTLLLKYLREYYTFLSFQNAGFKRKRYLTVVIRNSN